MKGYVSMFMTAWLIKTNVGKSLKIHQWWDSRINTVKYQTIL